jgi:hypothetical protein
LTEGIPVAASTTLTSAERVLRGKIAAHTSWANTSDRSARTAAARRAAEERFEIEVDPDGTLPPAERAKRAENARKAHFQRMALKSAQVRRARATAANAGEEDRAKRDENARQAGLQRMALESAKASHAQPTAA